MEARYTEEMTFIQDLSRRAGAVLMQHFGSDVRVKHKADRSLVTDADLASEKLIISSIKHHYPHDTICSEEAGLSSSDRTPCTSIWIIDPLDGTTNFSNQYPFFCVSIARAQFTPQGSLRIMTGAVHDPIRNKTYVAGRGHGAWVNHKKIQICADRPPEDAFLVTGFAYHRGDNLRKDIEFFLTVAQTCQSIRRDGAAALDLALVAEGVYDGYWETGLRPWDLAAGVLLVEEAGGIVKNYATDPILGYSVEKCDVICGTASIVKFIEELL